METQDTEKETKKETKKEMVTDFISKTSSVLTYPAKIACFIYNFNVFILSFFKAFLAIVLLVASFGFYKKLYTPSIKPYYTKNIKGQTVANGAFNIITSTITWSVETVLEVLSLLLNWFKDAIPTAVSSIIDLIKDIFAI
jgi:hypothetical protein